MTTRGRRLVQVCQSNQLAVVNGTSIDDESPGSLTSFQSEIRGEGRKAVVDYAIAHAVATCSTAGPHDEWSEHMAPILHVSRVLFEVRGQKRRFEPLKHTELHLMDPPLDNMRNMLLVTEDSQFVFGSEVYATPDNWARIYAEGVCMNKGTSYTQGGAGVFQARYASVEGTRYSWRTNRLERVNGRQDEERASLTALLPALQAADIY
ncbi:hypothetical protein D9619_007107 [Psilocybe cf. subviscida]|uniref:Uncharacterized protein n=1 Tax=Psilocybe cf. subviscida TaxID=2480587 RepID=A0A8H5B1I1_9AGAR|nr:hypothetical protein D9619_007107 [Psilocybe cf. subviscida]